MTRKKYTQAEKPLLILSGFLIAGLTATLLLNHVPPWEMPRANPFLFQGNSSFLVLLAATVGAVIMPFMIFFQASATGNKENEIQEDLGAESKEQIPRKKYLSFMRRETLFGAIVTELLMIITEMAFSNIPNAASTSSFTSAQELGSVLTPVAGIYSPYFFSIGLISAGFIALIVISMASAWGIGETLNISRRNIWLIYVVESLPGVVAALFIPPGYLISLVIYLLVFFVFVLIGPMAMIGLVGSNRKIMSNLAMSLREKVTYWITFTMVISTALLAVIYVF